MPKNVSYVYACSVCGKTFADAKEANAMAKARNCEHSHDLVYVPLTRAQVQDLITYIYTCEKKLIKPQLVSILKRYN